MIISSEMNPISEKYGYTFITPTY